jgi:DnaA family protein
MLLLGPALPRSGFYPNRRRPPASLPPMKQLILDIAIDPAPTFENFVAGPNAEVLAALQALAAGRSAERFFYLWGETGSGRTHLLRACAAECTKADIPFAIIEGAQAAATAFDTAAHIVLIDDIDCLDPAAQIASFNLYNRMRAGAGHLVASGKAPPAGLALRDDLRTRLASGLVYHVRGLTDDEKAAALTQHAAARGFRLPPEVAAYLLQHGRRDLPALLAVIEALDRHSLETRRAVTVPLLKEILQLPLQLRNG